MSVMNAFRFTTTAALGSVTATAVTVTHAANSMSALAETAAAHAEDYRNNSVADLKATSKVRQQVRIDEAKESLALRRVQLERRLAADPALRAAFDALDDKLFIAEDQKPALAVAAE